MDLGRLILSASILATYHARDNKGDSNDVMIGYTQNNNGCVAKYT